MSGPLGPGLDVPAGVWDPTPHGVHLGHMLLRLDFSGTHVLELGTGCGIHAILIARRGAARMTLTEIDITYSFFDGSSTIGIDYAFLQEKVAIVVDGHRATNIGNTVLDCIIAKIIRTLLGDPRAFIQIGIRHHTALNMIEPGIPLFGTITFT